MSGSILTKKAIEEFSKVFFEIVEQRFSHIDFDLTRLNYIFCDTDVGCGPFVDAIRSINPGSINKKYGYWVPMEWVRTIMGLPLVGLLPEHKIEMSELFRIAKQSDEVLIQHGFSKRSEYEDIPSPVIESDHLLGEDPTSVSLRDHYRNTGVYCPDELFITTHGLHGHDNRTMGCPIKDMEELEHIIKMLTLYPNMCIDSYISFAPGFEPDIDAIKSDLVFFLLLLNDGQLEGGNENNQRMKSLRRGRWDRFRKAFNSVSDGLEVGISYELLKRLTRKN